MGFLPTLKTSKFIMASVGGISVQPMDETLSTVEPASSPVRNVATLELNSDLSITKKLDASLNDFISSVSNPNVVLPVLRAVQTHIKPSYFQNLSHVSTRQDSSNDLTLNVRKFEPYEKLTGISHERPEIVMLLPFLPLFYGELGDLHMTDAGLYADAQMHVRNMKVTNIVKSLKTLKQNTTIHAAYKSKLNEFQSSLDQLQVSTKFLLDLVEKSTILKNQLDLRDDIFKVQPTSVAQALASDFFSSQTRAVDNVLQIFIRKYLPPTYDVPETLQKLGYSVTSTKEIFSSTKLWLQLLIEFKQLLTHHSLEFLDLETSACKNDQNSSVLLKNKLPLFGLSSADPAGIGSVSEITSVQVIELNAVLNAIDQAFHEIYSKGSNFKSDESRIAALANLLSKEHKFSSGLSQNSVRQSLTQFFAYNVDDSAAGNLQIFDSVVGKFGNNIFEFASNNLSLTNVSQQQPSSNVSILTFESKFLEGNNGSATPGSTYYVDSVLDVNEQGFNTVPVLTLNKLLADTHRNFSIIVNGLNLLSTTNADPSDRDRNNITTKIANPTDMVRYVLNSIVDKNGMTLPTVINDRMCCIYAIASKNKRIKSILFHYTLNRMLRSYYGSGPGRSNGSVDNTVTTDELVSQLINELQKAVKESGTLASLTNPSINTYSNEAIRTSMKQGTSLMHLIESWMIQVYVSLQESTSNAMINNRMRHSGQFDTVMMMIAFDLFVTLIGKYGNQQIISKLNGGSLNGNQVIYLVTKTKVNYKNSVNDVLTRLDRELTLTHQLTYCILNVLQKLTNATAGYVNSIQSQNSTTTINTIAKQVNDFELLKLLLSKQQIMLAGSNVADLISRFHKNSSSELDVDKDGDFDSDDEIKILDDSLISPKLRNALGIFKTSEFIGPRSYNKRILTVGIPLDFSRRLKQRVSQTELKNTSFAAKQHDIIQVVVYKVDLLNQDVIFKPQKFLFEMSRFPVRDDSLFRTIPEHPTIDDVMNAVPTRDYEEAFGNGENSVSYWNSAQRNSSGLKNSLSGETYAFLSESEKEEIIKNHLVSHMLEIYVKLMTNVSISDHNFDLTASSTLVDEKFVRSLADHKVHQLLDRLTLNKSQASGITQSTGPSVILSSVENNKNQTGGVLFSTTSRKKLSVVVNSSTLHGSTSQPRTSAASGVASSISRDAALRSITGETLQLPSLRTSQTSTLSHVNLFSKRHIPVVMHELATLNHFSRTYSSLSDGNVVAKKMLTPKQFDRVFTMIVDPDEFEIDFDKTTSTTYGRTAFEQMIKRGDLEPASTSAAERTLKKYSSSSSSRMSHMSGMSSRPISKGRADPNVNNFKFRERNRTEGDMLLDKYFVTIETYGEDGI